MAKKQTLSAKQKAIIADGKVRGKPGKQIAAEAQCSQSTVDHARQDPEIRSLIERFTDKYATKVERIFARSLDSLEADIGDKKATPGERRAAREQALEYITIADRAAGRIGGAAQQSSSDGEYTLTELYATVRQVTASK